MRSALRWLRGPLIGAAAASLVFTAAGGANHLGSLLLGHTNTADEPTTLTGNTSGNPELSVVNTASSAALRAESPAGKGVVGRHTSSSGGDAGVQGDTSSASSNAAGVLGQATSASAVPNSAGVKGTNAGIGAGVLGVGDGLGVYGRRGAGYYFPESVLNVPAGVRGDSDTGAGVVGESTLGGGVLGTHSASSGTNPGVKGVTYSTSGNAIGVLGVVPNIVPGSFSAGVKGDNAGTGASGIGVWGTHHGAGWGVYGSSPTGRGVFGEATGTSGVNYGVIGKTASPSGYAGYFMGKVHLTGNLEVGGPYAQLPDRTGAPPAADCDSASEAGRVVVRTDGSLNLYICRGSAGWIAK